MFKIYNGDAYEILDDLIKEKIKVDHVITDPPYNISKENNFATMNSAERTGVDFGEWDKDFDLTTWISKAASILNPGGSFIVFNSYRNLTPIINEINGLKIIRCRETFLGVTCKIRNSQFGR